MSQKITLRDRDDKIKQAATVLAEHAKNGGLYGPTVTDVLREAMVQGLTDRAVQLGACDAQRESLRLLGGLL